MFRSCLAAATVSLCFAVTGGIASAQSAPANTAAAPDQQGIAGSAPGGSVTDRKSDLSGGAAGGNAAVQQSSTSQPAVVVELYTSQGCSSCPPADEVLARLVGRRNVIPLALHVDYWDYIGWTDKMATPAFTRRQKAYARAIGSRTIYTPQLIIDGDDRIEGARPMDVAELIQEHASQPTPVRLELQRKGERVVIAASSDKVFPNKLLVQVVRYLPEKTVKIERGENAGQTITYRNIVTEWKTVGDWDGAAPMNMIAPAKGSEPVVVILQEPGPGEIKAAASLR